MVVKIRDSGSNYCHTLEARTHTALAELGLNAMVKKVAPGLVLDEKLVRAGRVPLVAEIKALISA